MSTARSIRSLTLTGLLAAAAVAAAPAAPGVSFTMRTTTRSGEGPESAPSVNRVRVQGSAMRFDAEGAAKQGTEGNFSPGAYTLLDGSGRRVVVVMPERQQFMEIRFDDTTTQALMTAMTVTTAVTDVTVRGESMGAGGMVNGMPTRRYRLTSDYKYGMTGSDVAGKSGSAHVVEDYWVAKELEGVTDPIEQVGRALGGRGGLGASPFSSIGGTSLSELLAKRTAEQRRLFKGMPARTVTTTTTVEPDEEKSVTVSTTEIADVSRADLDPALFRVPDGYAKFDMKQMMNVGAQLQSALRGKAANARDGAPTTDSAGNIVGETVDAAKDGAKEGAKEAARAGARDAASRKIRGIFRKP